MSSKLAVIAVVLLLLIGSWVTYTYTRPSESPSDTENVEANMGAYAYQCANGSQFTMMPNDSVSELTLEAGSQGMFTGKVIVHKMGDGNHFEGDAREGLVVFGGAGEEVSLTVGTEKTICNPVPNPDMAPWNWGDAGEGGSVQPDVTIVVGESIVGKWKSVDDAKFVREFKDGGVVVDSHGAVTTSGKFTVFTKEKPLTVAFPLADSTIYLQLTMGSPAEKLNFKVNKLTPEELELTYMDRGGVLRFTAVK